MDYPDNPRYAPPTQAELEEMFAMPTPAESLERCSHQGACLRALALLAHDRRNADERAAALGCAECEEWERI